MRLLHLDSSILGTHSVTRQLSAAVVAQWRANLPQLTVEYRDLDADPIPHLGSHSLAGSEPAEAAASTAVLQQFLAADVVVIGAPMYNFAIPSTLKAWIDRIAVAGKTFRYTADGPQGLAGGRQVLIASGRGSALGDHSAADFQEAYLRLVFAFIGIETVTIVRAEGVALSAGHREGAIQAALASIGQRMPLAA